MPTIQSGGAGSGIDVNAVVDALIGAVRDPAESNFKRLNGNLDARLSAMSKVKSSLSSFQETVSGLKDLSEFQARSISNGSEKLFSATADHLAAPGDYSVEVTQLAQAHSLVSGPFVQTTDTVGTGTLTFRFGTYDVNGFVQSSGTAVHSVSIGADRIGLQGIRDAINEADIGVRAAVVNTGSDYRLTFTSVSTGVDNSIEVLVSDDDGTDVDNAGLSRMAYDPTASYGAGKNLTQTVDAQDAAITINGLAVTRSENKIEGAIEGVVLDLKEVSSGESTNVSVFLDTEKGKAAVKSFVDGYNKLLGNINVMSHFDASTGRGGPLMGDSVLRSVRNQVQKVISASVTGLTGSVGSLADIGIATQKDGTLGLNDEKLNAVLENNFDEVGLLFGATGTPTDAFVRYVEMDSATKAGIYDIEVISAATQGLHVGQSGISLTVDSGNDTFSLKVDGVPTGSISLTQKVYASGDELAAEMQGRINGDPTLIAADTKVTVVYDMDHFNILTDSFGSGSSVEIVSVLGSGLGISAGSGIAGTDIAGTLGGVAATGEGKFLTGTEEGAEGLRVEILDNGVGSRGSVAIALGVAANINSLIELFLDEDGIVGGRIDGINERIKGIGEQRSGLAKRIEAMEDRLRSQFTSMDITISRLRGTSSFLSQQFNSV